MNKIVEYYFDDATTPIYTERLKENDSENRTIMTLFKFLSEFMIVIIQMLL